jgi:Spy/CpxP family protein refolding chaperone
MSLLRRLLLILVLTALAGAVGVVGGVRYIHGRMHQRPSLHQLVHEQLKLSAGQQQKIEVLERGYAERRAALESEMRAADADLAAAYQADHAFTPRVQAAIDRFHRASDALQKETMLHVVAMRQVLTPDQAARFDASVVRALTSDGS